MVRRMNVNDELGRIQKGAAVTHLEVISQHLPGRCQVVPVLK
jgi:hypothetical protein